MSTSFTFKAADELTSREVYHQLFHALRRSIGRTPELTLLYSVDGDLCRAFALHNGDEGHIVKANSEIDLRGCTLVWPAEELPVVVVIEAPVVEASVEETVVEAVEEVAAVAEVAEETPAVQPVATNRRGRRGR